MIKTPPIDSNFYTNGINVDGSGTCALKCPKCFRETMDIKELDLHHITPENFRKICKAFPDINLCGTFSDPIYSPYFHEILQVCIDENVRVEIHTNGHGRTDKWWETSFELSKQMGDKIAWIFALDGLPKDSHKYRINQDGEKVFERMKLGVTYDLDIRWQFILFAYNENDLEAAKKMSHDAGIKFLELYSSKWGEDYVDDPEADEYVPSEGNYIKNEKIYDTDSVDKIYPKCFIGRMTPAYIADGRILPCCMMVHSKTKLDDIKINDVEDIRFEIMLSDEWNEFYDGLVNDPKSAPDICKKYCGKPWTNKRTRLS